MGIHISQRVNPLVRFSFESCMKKYPLFPKGVSAFLSLSPYLPLPSLSLPVPLPFYSPSSPSTVPPPVHLPLLLVQSLHYVRQLISLPFLCHTMISALPALEQGIKIVAFGFMLFVDFMYVFHVIIMFTYCN